jgi:hypothetical protein
MERALTSRVITSLIVVGLTAVVACGSDKRTAFFKETNEPAPAAPPGNTNTEAPRTPADGFPPLPPPDNSVPDEARDPTTCAEAATRKSYVGCDYWPTVTPNPVWSVFDYTVVVANTSGDDVTVTVTGPKDTHKDVKVPRGELRKIYLPWVDELKGLDFDACTMSHFMTESAVASEAAYHLVSSAPVIVYQFNALEYKGEGGEAPDGGPKDWSKCPGTVQGCKGGNGIPVPVGCFSFSNDASLLLPSTAMTNTYRVLAHPGGSVGIDGRIGIVPTTLSITATQPDTDVSVRLSPTATVVKADSDVIPATDGGGTIKVKLQNAGDVAQLVSEFGQKYDFSGSLVTSSKPVQVIASVPCISIPSDKAACDHIEESIVPAETLGRHYVVSAPTGPKGNAVEHEVRLYGNSDGTTLTYVPSKPEGCPDTLEAGQVANCGLHADSFEVTANNPFGVATFLLGATQYDPTNRDRRGDPDQTSWASVEQFRKSYVFLAPTDYPTLWADIAATENAKIELDGQPLDVPWEKIGDGPYGVYRVDLTKSGNDGSHSLTAKEPVGLQILGFGDNTSFQYPGGMNLKIITPPPKADPK